MPKIVNHEERRAEMALAARRVIAAEGLAGATLRRVAEEAGCTTGAVTHYLRDRDELLVEALRSAHASAATRMAERVATDAAPKDRLRAVLLEALPLDDERLDEWRVWMAFWGEATTRPALAAEDEARYAEWTALLTALVEPLVPSPADRTVAVGTLTALVDGLALRLLLAPGDRASRRTDTITLVDAHLARLDG